MGMETHKEAHENTRHRETKSDTLYVLEGLFYLRFYLHDKKRILFNM